MGYLGREGIDLFPTKKAALVYLRAWCEERIAIYQGWLEQIAGWEKLSEEHHGRRPPP